MEKRSRKQTVQEGLHIVRRTDAQEIVADALGLSGQLTNNAIKEALVNWARAVVRRGGESIQHDALAKYASSVVESVDNPKRKEAVRKYLVELLSGTKVNPEMEHAKLVKKLIVAARDALASHARAKAQAKLERTIGEAGFSHARAIRNNALRRGLGNKYAAFRQIEALERSAAQRKSQGLGELVEKAYGIILPEKVVGTADESVDAVGELMKGRRSLNIEKTAQLGAQVVAFLDELEKGNITNPREYAEKNLTPTQRASLGKFLKFYGSYNKTARELARQLGIEPNPRIKSTATEEAKQQQAEAEPKTEPPHKPAGEQTEEKTPSEQVPQTPAETGAGKRGAEKMASPNTEIKSISKKQLRKLTVDEALAALESGMLGKHSLSVDAARQLAQAVVTALGNRLPPQKAGGIDVATNKDFFKSWVSEVKGTLSTDAEALALKLDQPAAAQPKRKTSTAQAQPAGGGEQTQPAGGGEQKQPAGGGEQTQPAGGGKQKQPAGGGKQKQPAGGGQADTQSGGAPAKAPGVGKGATARMSKRMLQSLLLGLTTHSDPEVVRLAETSLSYINSGKSIPTKVATALRNRLEAANKPSAQAGTQKKQQVGLANVRPQEYQDTGKAGKLAASGTLRSVTGRGAPRPKPGQVQTPQQLAPTGAGVSPAPQEPAQPRTTGRLGTLRGIAPHALTFIGAVALTKLLEALSERKKPAEIPAFPQPQVPQQGVWQQPIFPMFPMPQQFLPQQNQQQIPMFQTLPIIGPPAVINLEAFQ